MFHRSRVSLVLVAVVLLMPSTAYAGRSPLYPPSSHAGGHSTSEWLAISWKSLLELPLAENPFFGNGDACRIQDKVLMPSAGSEPTTCTIKPGTKTLLWVSSECSNVEEPPYFGRDERELVACARAADAGIRATLTIDGTTYALDAYEVVTGMFAVDLPEGNIFGIPPQRALSAAHGWPVLLKPLKPGTHNISLQIYSGTSETVVRFVIVVRPGAR